MVDYILKENPLTKDKPNDFYAQVVNVRSHTEEDIANEVVDRNVGISKTEALAFLEIVAQVELKWIKNGDSIKRRLYHMHPTIPGSYEEGEYPKNVEYHVTVTKEVAEMAKHISVQHVEAVNPIHINFIHDVKTNTSNEKITQFGTVKINGHNIKIAGTDPSIGVEFHSIEDPESIYKVPAVDIVDNNPSELSIIAPKMVTGEEVILKITTQFMGTTKLLKLPRSVTFERKLTVV
jgi:hypothetical protein